MTTPHIPPDPILATLTFPFLFPIPITVHMHMPITITAPALPHPITLPSPSCSLSSRSLCVSRSPARIPSYKCTPPTLPPALQLSPRAPRRGLACVHALLVRWRAAWRGGGLCVLHPADRPFPIIVLRLHFTNASSSKTRVHSIERRYQPKQKENPRASLNEPPNPLPQLVLRPSHPFPRLLAHLHLPEHNPKLPALLRVLLRVSIQLFERVEEARVQEGEPSKEGCVRSEKGCYLVCCDV
ncbi:hypothetical protein CVT25_010282 [Psilocybe cyanescens]|uniref:Uncharacterized protein n=1 Tax=Psilocybe cyanescens TaxID=93625 RepID=A0A409X2S9_PSICY|nr:hypothetical protein CVT25_010282 [Psilocybe cyanescens]